MSKKSVQAFIEKMKSDEAFSAKIMAVADSAERMDLVQAEGFDFTAEEIKVQASELSDDDLEVIVGGVLIEIVEGVFIESNTDRVHEPDKYDPGRLSRTITIITGDIPDKKW